MTTIDIEETLHAMGLPPPIRRHPTTQALVIKVNVERRQEAHKFYRQPPLHPSRFVPTAFDEDDEPIDWRQLSDAEYDEAIAAYERDRKEWKKNGGVAFTAGPVDTSATFSYADGSTVTASLDGDEWRVTKSTL